MKIVLAGGGTLGHIIPLAAVYKEIIKLASQKNLEKPEIMLISDRSDVKDIGGINEITLKTIKAGKLRRYFSLENIKDAFNFLVGIVQSLLYIKEFKPDIIFTKGGYASVPPAIAGWILKVPIFTHESDIKPGLANKFIARLAAGIFVSFLETKDYFPANKVVFTGNPIRKAITKGDKQTALKIFSLKENFPIILVYGGSQGAKKINEAIIEILPEILDRYQILHICGEKNYEKVKSEVEKLKLRNNENYKLHPFLADDLKHAYAVCDIIVSRAGANSLFEIIALNKPSIIIPISSSPGNHQFENAKHFERKGMLFIIEENALNGKMLIKKIDSLTLGREFRDEMIDKIKKYNEFFKKSAAEEIAERVLEYGI